MKGQVSTPPKLPKQTLEALLQIYDQNKSSSEQFDEHEEVQGLRQFIQALKSEALSEAEKNTLGLLVFYTSNATKISDFYSLENSQTQTLTLLGSIRKKLFPTFHEDVLAASDQHGNWLFLGDQAQVNFGMIVQNVGQYALSIAKGLGFLSSLGLLTGDQAAANRDALTKANSACAESITSGLAQLSEAGLLTGDQAQANRDALTQGGGEYALGIAYGLKRLSKAGLLAGNQAQPNFEVLTQRGGQYAEGIARGLECLSQAGLLTGDQAQTNRAFFLNCLKTDDEAGRSPEVLVQLLERVQGSDQLTQTAFYLLFQPECIEDVICDEIQALGLAIFMALGFSQEEVASLDVSIFVTHEIVLFYQSFCSSMDDDLLKEAFKLVKILLMDAEQPAISRGEAILSLCNKHLAEEKVGKKTPEEKKQRLEMMTYDVENYLAGKVSEEDFANQHLSAASQPLQRQEAVSYQGSFFHKVVINKVPQVVFHALGVS